jgi:curved DNA-binding protein CbpA
LAFEIMQLDENANAAAVRAKYAELVKRWHPDSNGGDRSAEEQLQRVIKAYQALKSAGLA